jgi:hypothetical protein
MIYDVYWTSFIWSLTIHSERKIDHVYQKNKATAASDADWSQRHAADLGKLKCYWSDCYIAAAAVYSSDR